MSATLTANAPEHSLENMAPIIKSDTVDLGYVASGIYVGVTGDVTIVTINDRLILLKNLLQGHIHRIRYKRVQSTGTGATDMVALW